MKAGIRAVLFVACLLASCEDIAYVRAHHESPGALIASFDHTKFRDWKKSVDRIADANDLDFKGSGTDLRSLFDSGATPVEAAHQMREWGYTGNFERERANKTPAKIRVLTRHPEAYAEHRGGVYWRVWIKPKCGPHKGQWMEQGSDTYDAAWFSMLEWILAYEY